MHSKRHRIFVHTLLTSAIAMLGCVNINLPGLAPEPLVETTVRGSGDAKILLLSIDGVMQESAGPVDFFGIAQESPISRMRDELDAARHDPAIRGVLLRINSPGGTVTAAEILYDEIRRFKSERGLPIVAQFMGVAASGGYYVAMAADEIVAYPTTVTGSIGVIASLFPNVTGLMEKIGVEDQTFVTGAFKDTGSATRPMREDERVQMQAVIDDLFQRFVEVVEGGRKNLSRKEIEGLADGRIYSARQAKDAGLVDHVGDIEVALERVRESAGLGAVRVIRYHRASEYQSNLFTRSNLPRAGAPSVMPVWPKLRAPGFFYLWAPGAAE
jgi:protease-4